MSNNIIASAKKGIIWSSLGRFGNQALTLISIFILARLIAPEEFGLIAMITVLSNFAILLIDLGFSSAIIYKKKHQLQTS